MTLRALSVQSGSCGNCIYVEAGAARLVFDAGVSGMVAQRRLAGCGIDIASADALVVSHDHADHMRSAGIFQRKFKLPLFATRKTLVAGRRLGLGTLFDTRPFEAGMALRFGDVSVQSIPTPHDAADGVAFVVEHARRRIGIFTDLGHAFAGLGELIATLDGVFIESNYDPAMLEAGLYPYVVQQRIRGPRGHLSNAEAAGLLKRHATPRLKWVALSHLSANSNTPELALETHRTILGTRFPLAVAGREGVSEVFEV